MGWGSRRPNSGGRRPGAGRKKATVTAEIREIARQYGPEAIAELARLAKHALSEQARVAAIKELFDRGYGRSVQPLVGTLEHGVSQQLATLSAGNEGNTLGAEIARRAALPPANGQRTDGPLPAMVPSKKTAVRAIAPI
jgi:hypothetical protein